MRRIFVSRSSLEKPRPLLRLVRIASPSRISTCSPRSRNTGARRPAIVDLPAPDRPVNQTVKPCMNHSLLGIETRGIELSLLSCLDLRSVDATLRLIETRPASGATVLAGQHAPRTMDATERRVAVVVQWVVRHIVLANVVPDVVLAPCGERADLHQIKGG